MIVHHLDSSAAPEWSRGAWPDTSGRWQRGKQCGSRRLHLPVREGKGFFVFFTRSISLVYCRLDVVSKSEWRKRKEEVWVYISPVDGRSSLLSAAPVNHWLPSAFTELCRHARTENIGPLMTVFDSATLLLAGVSATFLIRMRRIYSICRGQLSSRIARQVNHFLPVLMLCRGTWWETSKGCFLEWFRTFKYNGEEFNGSSEELVVKSMNVIKVSLRRTKETAMHLSCFTATRSVSVSVIPCFCIRNDLLSDK